jgi:hypothetical protein
MASASEAISGLPRCFSRRVLLFYSVIASERLTSVAISGGEIAASPHFLQ